MIKEYQKYDNEGRFLGIRKKVFHNRFGKPPRSLLCTCLRDGTLDVDLLTGLVTSLVGGKVKEISCIPDHSDYLRFCLCRERSTRRKKTACGRKRWRQTCGVHRLVIIKKIAIAKSADDWRDFVEDIPPTLHVDHIDLNRQNNVAANLRIQGFMENSNGSDPSVGEVAAIAAYTKTDYSLGDIFDEFA